MRRRTTYAPNSQILSADLNAMQDAYGPMDPMSLWMNGGARLYSTDGVTVKVAPIYGLVIGDDYGADPTELTVTPTGFLANEWGFIYVGVGTGTLLGAGSLFTSVSPTGPDPASGFRHKTGDPTLRYVGCFRMYNNGGAKIMPFRAANGVYRWAVSKILTAKLAINNVGVATLSAASYTNVTLVPFGSSGSLIAPHASVAHLQVTVSIDDTGAAYTADGGAEFVTEAADTGHSIKVDCGGDAMGTAFKSRASAQFDITTDGLDPAGIAYRTSNCEIEELSVLGFSEV
jgi:hypothetical protein